MTIARDATATAMTNQERGKPSSVTAEDHPIESTLGNRVTMGGMAEGMMMAAMTTVIKGIMMGGMKVGIMMGGMRVGIMIALVMREVVGDQMVVVNTMRIGGTTGSRMTEGIRAEADLGVMGMTSTVGVVMKTMIIGIKAEEEGI